MAQPTTNPKTPPLDPKYREQVAKRFNEVYAEAQKESEPAVDVSQPKIVIFSDHHKGARDGADDFQRCERAYCAALGYYLRRGFRLFVLGDAEELWEENPEDVIACYSDVLQLEAQFGQPGGGGLERFFGNHDDLWESGRQVKKHLGGVFPGIEVRAALHLPLTEGGKPRGSLLFAHGHQGTSDGERWGAISRLPVRLLWRPLQRKLGFFATTPATDFGLRGTHDRAMFEWVRSKQEGDPLILITGHTHRPVFSLPETKLRDEAEILEDLEHASGDEAANLNAELEYVRAVKRDRRDAALTVDPPCYFNTGCCSFPDGDVTGLEIEGGMIRLVRWPDNDEKPLRHCLAEKELTKVFDAIEAAPADQAEIIEQIV